MSGNDFDNAPLPEQFRDIVAEIEERARENVAESDLMELVAFVISDGGKRMDIVEAAFDHDDGKDGFAEFVRQRASRLNADAVLLLSEAWAPPEPLTREEAAAMRAQYGAVENFPNRVDTLMMVLLTYEGAWIANGNIASPAGQPRTVGPMQWHKGRIGGRFSKMLPVRYATPAEVAEIVAYARQKLCEAGLDPDFGPDNGPTMIGTLEAKMRQAPSGKLTKESIDTIVRQMALLAKSMGMRGVRF